MQLSRSDMCIVFLSIIHRAATAGKAGKVWSFPRFWVLISSYKKQPVKKFGGGILDLPWLKFAVAALIHICVQSYYLNRHTTRLLYNILSFFSTNM